MGGGGGGRRFHSWCTPKIWKVQRFDSRFLFVCFPSCLPQNATILLKYKTKTLSICFGHPAPPHTLGATLGWLKSRTVRPPTETWFGFGPI